MKSFTTRVASPSDEAGVSALLETSYSVLMARDYTPELLTLALPLICKANPALLRSGTYWVAENLQGEMVGCGGWTAQRPGSGDTLGGIGGIGGIGHIRHFATHPAWTRRGIGRVLMDACKDDARKKDVSRFECYSSLSARSFYAALDFQACGSIDIALGNSCLFPSVRMECPL